MLLLNVTEGVSITHGRVVPLERMSLQLTERDGTATITPADMDGVSVNQWLLDDRAPESGIVYRVRSVQESFANRTPTVSLEHIICTLKDRILFGEITPKTITGNNSATTCTARQAIEYILSQQSNWTLGTLASAYENVSNAYKFNGDTLYDALESVTDTLNDALWTCDMSSYPFTLNIVEHSSDVDSELRAGRNLQTISRTVDISGMFTRFYPVGKDDLHVSGNYIEKNADVYGVISKTETDTSRTTTAELTAWANEMLNRHAQPNVTITADGMELSRETGEDLDALTIGRVCRVPLPEYGTTIQERITEKNYPEKIGKPDIVKITLANSRRDVTKIIADVIKSGGRGGRRSAQQEKEDHAWFEDTDDHVAMVATGVIGVDEEGNPNWTRLSEFIADGQGLHAKVESQFEDVTERVATLELSESGIIMAVQDLVSGLGSTVEETAESIRAEVHAAESSLYSFILETASQIVIRVGEGNMVFSGTEEPQGTAEHPLVDGDLWLESTFQRTWADAEELDAWIDDEQFDWSDLKGSKVHVYDAEKGEFREVLDEQILAQDADIENTSEKISLVARAVKEVDGKVDVFRAELKVRSDEIASTVTKRVEDVGSSIRQTATQIRSEVHAANSQVYSAITQTASQIRSEVVNTADGLQSQINQTASAITLTVKKNEIISSINQTAEEIKISASKISLDGNAIATALSSVDLTCQVFEATQGTFAGDLTVGEGQIYTGNLRIANGGVIVLGNNVRHAVSWQSATIYSYTRSESRNFVYAKNGNLDNLDKIVGSIITDWSSNTIHFIGY